MITKVKLKQLERKYDSINNISLKSVLVVRKITQDGKIMSDKGYLLNEIETKQIKEEDEAIGNSKGTVVYLTSYLQGLSM